MRLYPAIDLKDGKCVRLFKGDYNQMTVFGEPVEMAKKWESQGAKFLHLVDLDGAKDGVSKNLEVIKDIIANINIPVELGGGIRNIEQIKKILDIGVSRVILGSIAVKNPAIVKEAIDLFGSERIVVGVDAKEFKVAINGWLEDTKLDALEFCKELEQIGVKYVIFTDISKDGTMTGVNLEQTKVLVDNTNLEIIASGGVASIDDLRKVDSIGCEGVIIGKAIYLGTINLEEAEKEFD